LGRELTDDEAMKIYHYLLILNAVETLYPAQK